MLLRTPLPVPLRGRTAFSGGRTTLRIPALALALVAVAPLAVAAVASVRSSPVETELERIWRRVEPALPKAPPPFLWRRHQTPPLPLAWPPDGKTVWVRHAFAYGFDPRLSDGSRVTAPWALLHLDREGHATSVEAAPGPVRELGIQGIVPTHPPSGAIDPEEIARFERLALGVTALPKPGSNEESALLAFYGRWLAREGVIANGVRAHHRDFFAWLERSSS